MFHIIHILIWKYKKGMDVRNRGWVVPDAKVVGIRVKGRVMVAGRFQKGCGKVIYRLYNGCWKVIYRLYNGCWKVTKKWCFGCGRSFHNVISQRCYDVIWGLHNDVAATSLRATSSWPKHDVLFTGCWMRTKFCKLFTHSQSCTFCRILPELPKKPRFGSLIQRSHFRF